MQNGKGSKRRPSLVSKKIWDKNYEKIFGKKVKKSKQCIVINYNILKGGPKMIMKNYVADELSNKVYHLTLALEKANEIIEKLDEENKNLKEVLNFWEGFDKNKDHNISICQSA